jgi:hypothetical protein
MIIQRRNQKSAERVREGKRGGEASRGGLCAAID